MNAIQFDFFNDNSEIGIIKQRVDNVETGMSKIRKGIFSRQHELEKKIISLEEKCERLLSMLQTKAG